MVALINCLSYTTDVLNKLLESVCPVSSSSSLFSNCRKKEKMLIIIKRAYTKGPSITIIEIDCGIKPSSVTFWVKSQNVLLN